MSTFNLHTVRYLVGALVLVLASSASAQSIRIIDVLGVYPDHIAERVSDPVAMFVHNIEYANTALQNSGANYRYNLVHVEQANWSNDAGLGSNQLASMRSNAAINGLREQYGADLVAGIVPQSNGLCGIGYLAIKRSASELHPYGSNYAFSLTGHSCGGRTMAHELGHNMGLGHSYAQGSSGTLAPWARGHGEQGTFVTIMAYTSAYGLGAGGRLQMHSTPTRNNCTGSPCGKDISAADGADAVRALNLGSVQIADYRESTNPTPNLEPDAVDDDVVTDQDQPITFNVRANDSDPDGDAISVVSISQPTSGNAALINSRGDVRYTPDPEFFGADVFDYTLQDANGAQSSAKVDVTVNQVLVEEPPSGPVNLVLNSDFEEGIDDWFGVWRMRVSPTSKALVGDSSLQARRGYGLVAKLDTPFAAGRKFELNSQLIASRNNRIYLYLRVLSGGQWSYRYLGYQSAVKGTRVEITKEFELRDESIDDGYVLFYFPHRARGNIRFDSVTLTPK